MGSYINFNNDQCTIFSPQNLTINKRMNKQFLKAVQMKEFCSLKVNDHSKGIKTNTFL